MLREKTLSVSKLVGVTVLIKVIILRHTSPCTTGVITYTSTEKGGAVGMFGLYFILDETRLCI